MDAQEPDKYTAAYYHREIRGINHRLNQQACEQQDQFEMGKRIRERLEKAEADLKESEAKIGELAGRLEEQEKKHEVMAEWIKNQFKKKA